MAESKNSIDIEKMYDDKVKLIDKWNNKILCCRDLLEGLRIYPTEIETYHDMDPVMRAIRYTDKEEERYNEGSAIWIRVLGYQAEVHRIQQTMPNFEGMDLVTGKKKFKKRRLF